MDERGQGFEKAADLVKKLVERAVLHPFRAMHGPVLQHAASVCNSVATCGNCGNMWQRLQSHHTESYPIMPGVAHVCPGIPECSRPTAGEEDGRESFAPSMRLSQLINE